MLQTLVKISTSLRTFEEFRYNLHCSLAISKKTLKTFLDESFQLSNLFLNDWVVLNMDFQTRVFTSLNVQSADMWDRKNHPLQKVLTLQSFLVKQFKSHRYLIDLLLLLHQIKSQWCACHSFNAYYQLWIDDNEMTTKFISQQLKTLRFLRRIDI